MNALALPYRILPPLDISVPAPLTAREGKVNGYVRTHLQPSYVTESCCVLALRCRANVVGLNGEELKRMFEVNKFTRHAALNQSVALLCTAGAQVGWLFYLALPRVGISLSLRELLMRAFPDHFEHVGLLEQVVNDLDTELEGAIRDAHNIADLMEQQRQLRDLVQHPAGAVIGLRFSL